MPEKATHRESYISDANLGFFKRSLRQIAAIMDTSHMQPIKLASVSKVLGRMDSSWLV